MTKLVYPVLLLFAGIALTVFACVSSEREHSGEEQDPNIIYILADDMGYGDIQSLNSQSKIETQRNHTQA